MDTLTSILYLQYIADKIDDKLVKKAIKTVRSRRGIESNKSCRFQSYQLFARFHKLRQRTELPIHVIKAVRDAFPDNTK